MLLTAQSLSKTFTVGRERTTVLNGVSFQLDAGQTMALTGESGSGKSTLLHLVGGLDAPDAGTVHLNDQEITGQSDRDRAKIRRSSVGIVFQQFNLIPSLTVEANLAFQARLARTHDADWSAALATRLGLEAHLNKYPEQLSGGQQQRVAIGRALAGRPALILADEPTGNLDEANGDAVMDLLLELGQEANAGLLMVTHSSRLADRLSRRLHLSNGTLQ